MKTVNTVTSLFLTAVSILQGILTPCSAKNPQLSKHYWVVNKLPQLAKNEQ